VVKDLGDARLDLTFFLAGALWPLRSVLERQEERRAQFFTLNLEL
jgi:hypothetical protein